MASDDLFMEDCMVTENGDSWFSNEEENAHAIALCSRIVAAMNVARQNGTNPSEGHNWGPVYQQEVRRLCTLAVHLSETSVDSCYLLFVLVYLLRV